MIVCFCLFCMQAIEIQGVKRYNLERYFIFLLFIALDYGTWFVTPWCKKINASFLFVIQGKILSRKPCLHDCWNYTLYACTNWAIEWSYKIDRICVDILILYLGYIKYIYNYITVYLQSIKISNNVSTYVSLMTPVWLLWEINLDHSSSLPNTLQLCILHRSNV